MTAFRWPFATRGVSRRERVTIAAGALVMGVGAFAVYVVVPFAAHWAEREAAIAVKAEQRARMVGLVMREADIRARVAEIREGGVQAARALVAGETHAVAASALVTLLNGYARDTGIELERVDLTAVEDSAMAGLVPIPLEVSGRGPLSGLVDLLFYLRYGDKLILIDDFYVNATTAGPSADEVVWGATMRAYYAPAWGTE